MTSILPKNSRVSVLGAGISGLTYSYFLHKLRPDLHISIFEKSSHSSGWINSSKLQVTSNNNMITLEKGPRTLRGVKEGTLFILDILRNLQAEQEIQYISKDSPANRKYLVNESGEIVQIPNSISSLVKFISKVSIVDSSLVLGMIKEPFVKRNLSDETVEEFFKRRFGSTVITDNIISGVIHGIYAGDVGKLSIESVFPQLKQIERESGSIIKHMFKKTNKEPPVSSNLQMYEKLIHKANFKDLQNKLKNCPMITLRNGLQTFPIKLTEYLTACNNITFHYNTPITDIDPIQGQVNGESFNHIRSTINVNQLAKALPISNPLVPHLNSIQYVNVFLCNIYTKHKLIPNSGFGFLVPRFRNINSNPQALLGVIYDSEVEKYAISLFNKDMKKQVNYDKITIMMGGHYYNHWEIPSKSINLTIVKQILESKLNIDLSKFNIRIVQGNTVDYIADNDLVISYNYHYNCIPQYEVGYMTTKQQIEQIVDTNQYKLSFGGTVFGDGIAVPDCVSNAFKDAIKQL